MSRARIAIDFRMQECSGIGRYLTSLTRHMKAPHPIFLIMGKEINHEEKRHRFRRIWADSPIFSLREQIRLPRALRRHGVGVLHSPHFNIPLLYSGKQVTTIHDCAYDHFPNDFPSIAAKLYYKLFFPLALRKSDRIIAVSESTRGDLLNRFGIPEGKVRVVPNGIDPDYYGTKVKNKKLQRDVRRGYSLDCEYGLYVGITRPWKNIVNLLKAAKIVRSKKRERFKIVLAGKIDTRFLDVRNLAHQLGIDDIVIQTGFVSDEVLVCLYEMARFLIYPSVYEGFGLPILEAMACGTPVIASNTSALPEVAGNAAILTAPHDTHEMAGAMLRLFENDDLRNDLIMKGRERIKEFSWQRAAEMTMDTYRSVLCSQQEKDEAGQEEQTGKSHGLALL